MTLSVSAGQFDRFPDSDKYYGGLDLTRDLANGVSAQEIQAFMANNPDLVRSEETRALINNLDTSIGGGSSGSGGGGGGTRNITKENNFPSMPSPSMPDFNSPMPPKNGGGGFDIPESQIPVFDPGYGGINIDDSFNTSISQQNNSSQDQMITGDINVNGNENSVGNYMGSNNQSNNASVAKELALNYMFGKQGLVFS